MKTFIILGVALGSSLIAYATLVVALRTGQPLMIVASNSMEPTIGVGDTIAVGATNPSQVRLGTVIVYQKASSDIKVVHRVVCITTSTGSECMPSWYPFIKCYTPPCYYAKGDNNAAPDPWVILSDELIGMWTGFKIQYLGMALICLRQDPACPTPWGLISVTALGSTVVGEIGFEHWLSKRVPKSQKSGSADVENTVAVAVAVAGN